MPSDTPRDTATKIVDALCNNYRTVGEAMYHEPRERLVCSITDAINTLHAENERLRQSASRVLSAHRSHIDNTPHPTDKYENERRDSLIALRTALENRP